MNRWVMAAVAIVLVVSGVGIGLAVGGGDQEETTPPKPENEPTAETDESPREEPAVEAFFEIPPASITSKFLFAPDQIDLPQGSATAIEVVKEGTYDQQNQVLPIVLRNNSDEAVVRPTVTGTAQSDKGKLLASGEDQTFHPNLLLPGEVAFGYVYFGASLPQGTNFELKVGATPVSSSDAQFENIRDLIVQKADIVAGDFSNRGVGFIKNPYDYAVAGPIDVSYACFSTDGQLLNQGSGFTNQDRAQPGERLAFQIDLFEECPVFMAGASGFTE